MPPELAAEIIGFARALWPPAGAVEVTLEANPADRARFAAFADAGVDRLSLGVQSLDDAALRWLGRDHDAAAARAAIRAAIEVFPRVSLDLIYALPGQDLATWTAELRAVLDHDCEHLSAYQLTIEPGTAFARAEARGNLSPSPPDLAADLFEATQSITRSAGFDAYEVSNHSRGREARSRHNLIYWRGGDYLGIGPGAHGRLTLGSRRWATAAPRRVSDYIARVTAGQGPDRESLAARDVALERLLMGLRTNEGVGLRELAPLAIGERRLEDLAPFVARGGERLRLTRRGRPVLDRIVAMLADGA